MSDDQTPAPVAPGSTSHTGMWVTIIILGLALIASATVLAPGFLVCFEGERAAEAAGKTAEKVHDTIVNDISKLADWFITPGEISIITIGTTQGAKEIWELATYETTQSRSYSYNNSWFGSEKSLQLTRRYRIKYGIAADSEIKLQCIGKNKGKLTDAHIIVLSCEPISGSRTQVEDEGLWNKLTAEDRNMAEEELQKQARRMGESDTAAKNCAREALCRVLNDLPALQNNQINITLPQ